MRQREAYQQQTQQSPPPDADMYNKPDTFRPIQPHELPSSVRMSPSPRIGDANTNGMMMGDSDSARRPYSSGSPRGFSPLEMHQGTKSEMDASSNLRLAIAQNAYPDSSRRTPPPPSPPPRSPYLPRAEKTDRTDRTGTWDMNNERMSPSVGAGLIRPFDGSLQTADGMYQSPAIRALEAQQRPPSLDGRNEDQIQASPASRALDRDASRPGCLQPFGSTGGLMYMYIYMCVCVCVCFVAWLG
jgi:hypothetical protein